MVCSIIPTSYPNNLGMSYNPSPMGWLGGLAGECQTHLGTPLKIVVGFHARSPVHLQILKKEYGNNITS
jgi:hypothetical protein